MTDDWSRYDANDAIVKTSSLQPQDMRDFEARYQEELERDWKKILQRYDAGEASLKDRMQVEGNWRMKITYQILQEDLIERLGLIEPAVYQGKTENAVDELCRRIREHAPSHPNIAEDTVRDFVGRGYLSQTISDEGCRWSWSR